MTATDHALFSLCGGHAALDFVNSLDDRFGAPGPVERLADYRTLLRFAVATGLLDAGRARRLARLGPGAAGRAMRAARELREALAAALYAWVDGHAAPRKALRVIERHLQRAGRHRELRWERPRPGQALSWDWARGNEAELPVWLLVQSAAELFTSGSMQQVRACDADTCRWLFLDTSRNHTRRWCDMKVCGNRMKARRFQARHET
ncbi:MAG TPA: CGNR zinc finger domain-containing protein [Steroidobacteraceae bacterium]|nr:CGNR zinc finger domain-containing protein [Steroidobacteraceae bacterium]